jgi:hypothetical protein
LLYQEGKTWMAGTGPAMTVRTGRHCHGMACEFKPETVIPGRANGSRECAPDDRLRASPESITTVFMFSAERRHGGYGFRACAKRRIPE